VGVRVLDFWELHTGPNAKTTAERAARDLRATGRFVRVFKRRQSAFNWARDQFAYAVFVL